MSGLGLSPFLDKPPSERWRWKDRYGEFHRPRDMGTRHLFHTLRMIWNNHVPTFMYVGNVIIYRFPKFYTNEYICEAVRNIARELATRSDLTEEWRRQLEDMASWFSEGAFSRVHPLAGISPLLEKKHEDWHDEELSSC